MPLLPNSFSFFKIILKILIQLILIIYYSFPQLFLFSPQPIQLHVLSLLTKQAITETVKQKHKNPHGIHFMLVLENCYYTHCQSIVENFLFSISDQLSVTDSFLFWGVGFSAACFLWQELVYLGLYRSCSSCLYC